MYVLSAYQVYCVNRHFYPLLSSTQECPFPLQSRDIITDSIGTVMAILIVTRVWIHVYIVPLVLHINTVFIVANIIIRCIPYPVSISVSILDTGMSFSLQSRDIIADSIETVMGGQWYDANIAIPGCDKNMPGCLIAMGRVNRPSIMVRTVGCQSYCLVAKVT